MYISGPSLINQIKRDAQEKRQQQSIAQALQAYEMQMAKWTEDETTRRRDYSKKLGKHKTEKGWKSIGANIAMGFLMNSILPIPGAGKAATAGLSKFANPLLRMLGKTVGGNMLGDWLSGEAPTAPTPTAMPQLAGGSAWDEKGVFKTPIGRAFLSGPKSPLADIATERAGFRSGSEDYSTSIADAITNMNKSQFMTSAAMSVYPELTNMMPEGINFGELLGKGFQDFFKGSGGGVKQGSASSFWPWA